MRTTLILMLLLAPQLAHAGTVNGTILFDGPTARWVKIPDALEVTAELRSQVAEPRFAEVHGGEFSFEGVPEGGGYEVWVHPPEGFDSDPVQNICVTRGVVHAEFKLTLHAYYEIICVPCRGPLSGRVLRPDGKPARETQVSLWVGGREVGSTQTRRNGKFRFEDVTQLGEVTIQIVRAGFPLFRSTFRRDPFSAGGAEHRFTLPECTLPGGQPNNGAAADPGAHHGICGWYHLRIAPGRLSARR